VTARFYVPGADTPGMLVTLPDEEAEHLVKVLRLRAGDIVRVFNGRGAEFEGSVEHADRLGVRVRLGESRESAQETRVAITLAQAVLKGDKMDSVVRDAVMMGVVAFQPIVSARSEVTLTALERGHRRERWERIAVASAKQCGRAVIPSISKPCVFETLAAGIAALQVPNPGLMFVEPSAAAEADALSGLDVQPPREVTVIVGPEGGWTPEEITRGAAACRLISLPGRTLRADAMPLVAISALLARWGEL
jgi:16S rRNA (uracil1498-N3)-methyltransferase